MGVTRVTGLLSTMRVAGSMAAILVSVCGYAGVGFRGLEYACVLMGGII